MIRLSSRATTVLKVVVSIALVSWLVSAGKLTPSIVAGALGRWPLLVAAAGVFYFQIASTAWRWNLLLAAQEIVLPFRDAFSLTMIGSLFNVIIPGSVGGDVIKGYYVTIRADGKKSLAITSILVDRIIGLLGLLILAAGAAAWNYSDVTEPAIRSLCLFTILIALGGVVGVVLAVAIGPRIHIPEDSGRVRAVLAKVLAGLMCYRRRPLVILGAFALSVAGQALACYTFYLCSMATSSMTVPLHYLFFIVPLGLVTTAVPLTPAGVGVGQAAFYSLFQMVPNASPSLGANAFTVYQFIYLAVYMTGLGFYLAYKNRPSTILAASAASLPAA